MKNICEKCKGLGYYDEGHENDDGSMSGGIYVHCEKCVNKKEKQAYHFHDENGTWLHIIDGNGEEWQEPIKPWSLCIDLIMGGTTYRNEKTNEVIKAI